MLKGKNTEASAEANKLMTATINKLSAAVAKAYDDSAVVAVITVSEHHVRSKRQAKQNENVSLFIFFLS